MSKDDFETKIGYHFEDGGLLDTALTHSSYTREHGQARKQCNERLEFLGDALFDAIIGEELFKRLPDTEEGMLTKYRAAVVCERSLAAEARKLGLGELMSLGRGEEITGGRDRESIIADAMEAIIGAVFLDGGYDCAKKIVLGLFMDTVEDALSGKLHSDYKTEFQETAQRHGTVDIEYTVDRQTGPDHDKTFYVTVSVNDDPKGSGIGKSRKEAEQNAARDALSKGE